MVIEREWYEGRFGLCQRGETDQRGTVVRSERERQEAERGTRGRGHRSRRFAAGEFGGVRRVVGPRLFVGLTPDLSPLSLAIILLTAETTRPLDTQLAVADGLAVRAANGDLEAASAYRRHLATPQKCPGLFPCASPPKKARPSLFIR